MRQRVGTDGRVTLVIHKPERLGRSPRSSKLVRNKPPRLPREAVLVARAVLFAFLAMLLAAVVNPVGVVRGEVARIGLGLPEMAGKGRVPCRRECRGAMERVAVVTVDQPERVVVPVCIARLVGGKRCRKRSESAPNGPEEGKLVQDGDLGRVGAGEVLCDVCSTQQSTCHREDLRCSA